MDDAEKLRREFLDAVQRCEEPGGCACGSLYPCSALHPHAAPLLAEFNKKYSIGGPPTPGEKIPDTSQRVYYSGAAYAQEWLHRFYITSDGGLHPIASHNDVRDLESFYKAVGFIPVEVVGIKTHLAKEDSVFVGHHGDFEPDEMFNILTGSLRLHLHDDVANKKASFWMSLECCPTREQALALDGLVKTYRKAGYNIRLVTAQGGKRHDMAGFFDKRDAGVLIQPEVNEDTSRDRDADKSLLPVGSICDSKLFSKVAGSLCRE